MRTTRRLLLLASSLAAAALFAPAPATADEVITAGGGNRYLTANPTIDQGERLVFQNRDFARHDVVARMRGANGRPLFSSQLIDPGRDSVVEGAQQLTTGRYEFFCSIHPNMVGNLTVTSAGTPLPPPGGGGGGGGGTAEPLSVNARVASSRIARVVRERALAVVVSVSGGATVRGVASGRIDGRTVRLGSESATFGDAARGTLAIPISRRTARRLARERSVRVRVRVTATPASGDPDTATASRTLR